ncbi:MAG TPA: thiosulfate oxidation carrier complex protein SoxZ [Usitatibacter sp.]|nr:thiosulfate oxidation carrier complex protein SoxZ [Usitatibacter sp.]
MILGRIQVPPNVRKDEPFEVRILVQHPMETGYRRDLNGQAIPLHIVDRLVCRVGGREVFSAELGSGIAANPYMAFYAVADASGEVEVEWKDNRGETGRVSAKFSVA